MSKMNAVVVGCGAIGPIHMNAVHATEYAALYGVCDIEKERADRYAKEFGCKAFYSVEDVLRDQAVDSIHICTPHYLHGPMLTAAVSVGKKAVVEKPVCMNLNELREVYKTVRKMKVPVCSVIQNRLNPSIVKLKEIIDNQTYGKVKGLKGILTWNRPPEYYKSAAWRGKWDTEGGGLVINQALHTLDLLCYLGGTPEAIKASCDTRALQEYIEVEDTAEATLYLRDGILAHFYATNNYSMNSSYDIEVHMEKAWAKYMLGGLWLMETDSCKQIAHDKEMDGEKAYWGIGHKALIDRFYTNLAGRGGAYTSFEDAFLSVALVDGLYNSARSGEKLRITLDL